MFCVALCWCLCVWRSKDLFCLYRLVLVGKSLLISGSWVDSIISRITVKQVGAGSCGCCWFQSGVHSWGPVTRGSAGHGFFLVFEWTGLLPGPWSLGLVLEQRSASGTTVGLLPGVHMGVSTSWSVGELLTSYLADLWVNRIGPTLWLTEAGIKSQICFREYSPYHGLQTESPDRCASSQAPGWAGLPLEHRWVQLELGHRVALGSIKEESLSHTHTHHMHTHAQHENILN